MSNATGEPAVKADSPDVLNQDSSTSNAAGKQPAANTAGLTLARLIVDGAILLASVALFFNAGQLPTSRWEPLGAGSFPQLVFALLALLAALSAVESLRALLAADAPFKQDSPGALAIRWCREHYLVPLLFVLFSLYVAAVPRFGFTLSTFGFMLTAGLLLAPRTPRAWCIALVLTIVFSFGLNHLFADVFNVFLPRGRA